MLSVVRVQISYVRTFLSFFRVIKIHILEVVFVGSGSGEVG